MPVPATVPVNSPAGLMLPTAESENENVAVAVDTPAAWQGYTTGNDKFLAIYKNLTAAAVQFGLMQLTDQGGAK